LLEVLNPDSIWPPQLVGLLMSMAGMIAGSLLPELSRRATHHAAAHPHPTAQSAEPSQRTKPEIDSPLG
jgi:hypothetical protein